MNTAAHCASNTAIAHSVMNTAAHSASNIAIVHSVMNTAAHIGHCSTAHCDWLPVHINLTQRDQLAVSLRIVL